MTEKEPCSTELSLYGEDQGCYYTETKRCVVYLNKHESSYDIRKTIDHELFHYLLDKLKVNIDEEQEHKLIFYLQWAEEYIGG